MEFIDKALAIDPGCVDGWAYLYQHEKLKGDDEK